MIVTDNVVGALVGSGHREFHYAGAAKKELTVAVPPHAPTRPPFISPEVTTGNRSRLVARQVGRLLL